MSWFRGGMAQIVNVLLCAGMAVVTSWSAGWWVAAVAGIPLMFLAFQVAAYRSLSERQYMEMMYAHGEWSHNMRKAIRIADQYKAATETAADFWKSKFLFLRQSVLAYCNDRDGQPYQGWDVKPDGGGVEQER